MAEFIIINEKTLSAFAPFLGKAGAERAAGESSFAVGAVEDGRASGAALVTFEEYDARLTGLFVDPARRRRGLGRRIVNKAVDALRGSEYGSLLYAGFEGENEAFCAACGFTEPENVGAVLSFDAKSLAASPRLAKLGSAKLPGINVGALSELPPVLLRQVSQAMYRQYGAFSRPVNADTVALDMSSACFDAKSLSFRGAVLCCPAERGVDIRATFVVPGAKACLVPLLAFTASRASRLRDGTRVSITVLDPGVRAIVDKLAGSVERDEIRLIERRIYVL